MRVIYCECARNMHARDPHNDRRAHDEKDAEIAKLKGQLKQIQETARWNGQRCDEEATAAGEAQRRAEAAEAEVIQLKAKLYDLLVAGK